MVAAGLGVEAGHRQAPAETLVRNIFEWEGPLMGDKTWAALFDNTKVKRVSGYFACESDLGEVLKALVEASPKASEHDRIAREQRALSG
jgi:hypothetical protein